MRSFSVAAVMAVVLLGCDPNKNGPNCPLEPSQGSVELGVEGLQSTIVLHGPTVACAGKDLTATIEVIDPEGVRQNAAVPPFSTREAFDETGRSLGVVFVAALPLTVDKPGRWSITATWSTGGTTTTTLAVAKRLTTGPSLLRRFVDRMDQCLRGPFRTSAGLTACQREEEVWIYSAEGQIQEHFPGSQLAVRGDEIWSWKATGELEHRTALPGAVRFDGAVPLSGGGAEGVTKPNLAVRGEPNRILEISWNGTNLSSRTIAEGYRFSSRFVIAQDTQTWSEGGCLVERGCSQTLCDPVITCRMPTENLLAIDDQAIWFLRTGQGGVGTILFPLVANPRPLTTDRTDGPTVRVLVRGDSGSFISSGVTPMLEVPRMLRFVDSTVIPRLRGTEIDFVAVPTQGALVTMTEEWIVSIGNDPFTLLATPTPALQ